MKKILMTLILVSILACGCGASTETQQPTEQPVQTEQTADLKKAVADFCSDAELVVSCCDIAIADGGAEDTSDGDGYVAEMEKLYNEAIKDSTYDTVHINDIKESAATILDGCQTIWGLAKDGGIEGTDYEDYQNVKEGIEDCCNEIKSYLE